MEKQNLGKSRKRSDKNLLVKNVRRKGAKPRTPLARRMAYGVGHIMNDLAGSFFGSYILVFQTKILGLSNRASGIIWMASGAIDAVVSVVVGYACDNISIPHLSAIYGRRKLCNLMGTILVAGLFPFLLMPCFACENGASEWVLLSYYLVLTVLMNAGWSAGQVSHLALIPEIAKRPGEMVELNALRSVFAFLSGIFMYGVTWVMLDTDSSQEELSPDQWRDFMKLAVIAIGAGGFFSLIFHLGTVEPKPQVREQGPVLQGRERARSRTRSFRALTGKAIDGICFDYTEDDFEMKNRSDSVPPSYASSALDFIEEDMSLDNPAFQSENNDPDGKPSVRIGDPSCHVSKEAVNTVEIAVSVQVDLDDTDRKKKSFSISNTAFQVDDGDDDEMGNYSTLRETNRDRSTSVRSVQIQFDADTRSCRTDSSDFVDEDNSTKDVESIASIGPLESGSENNYEKDLTDKNQGEKSLNVEHESRAQALSDHAKKAGASPSTNVIAVIIEDVDYQEKLHAAKLKAADVMSWKDWFKKPLFYKVSFAYMCMHLVKVVPRTYLPLYLTDTLHFNKEAIAYFPLVILISGVLSSANAKKLDKILGIKWTYALASALVMGSSAWFFFLGENSKQAAYGAAILLGCGTSVMYVTSLALAAELIGENKESGAFVYAAMTILGRIVVGLAVALIQEFFPADGSSGEYVRHMFSIVSGAASFVGFMTVLAFFPATMACSKIVHTADANTQTDDLDVWFDDSGLKVPEEYKVEVGQLRSTEQLLRS